MVMLLDSLRDRCQLAPKYYTLAGPVVYVEKLNTLMIQCKEYVVKLQFQPTGFLAYSATKYSILPFINFKCFDL